MFEKDLQAQPKAERDLKLEIRSPNENMASSVFDLYIIHNSPLGSSQLLWVSPVALRIPYILSMNPQEYILDPLFLIWDAARDETKKKLGNVFFFRRRELHTTKNLPYLRQPLGKGLPFVQNTYILSKQWHYLWSNQQARLHNIQKPPSWSSRVDFVRVLSTYQITCPPPPGKRDTFVLGPQNRVLLQHVFFYISRELASLSYGTLPQISRMNPLLHVHLSCTITPPPPSTLNSRGLSVSHRAAAQILPGGANNAIS